MADTTTTTDAPTPAPLAPTPAEVAPRIQPQAPAQPEEQPEPEDDGGRGGKAAILADLATERDKRQAAETTAQETAAKLDAVLTALGLGTGDTGQSPDVDALTRDLAAQRAETAVLRAGQGIADVDALLDSRSFTASLQGLDPSDLAAVKAHITQFVDANPRYAPQQAGPQTPAGVRDAAAGTGTPPPAPDEDMAFANFLTGHAPH